jgi:hypothetical protein
VAGRPRLEIDPEKVEQLARVGATQAEMARHFNVSLATLTRRLTEPRYSGVYERGHADLCISLRRKQVELALAGNATMLVWTGKQILGQKEHVEHSGTGPGGSIDLNVSARELLARRIAQLAERKREG